MVGYKIMAGSVFNEYGMYGVVTRENADKTYDVMYSDGSVRADVEFSSSVLFTGYTTAHIFQTLEYLKSQES